MALRQIIITVDVPDYHAANNAAVVDTLERSLDIQNADYEIKEIRMHYPATDVYGEIERTRMWFVKAGQMLNPPAFSVRQTLFYLGMQCEELAEKLNALTSESFFLKDVANRLDSLGRDFKSGDADDYYAPKLASPEVREAMLDADCDLMWVSIGAAYAQGADMQGAYGEVLRANWDKFPDGVVTRDPTTGKVLKPEGWRAPNLKPFIKQ